MPTLIEQKVPYRRDVVVPLEHVEPGEDVTFKFVSLGLQWMNFLAKCAPDDMKSDVFIFGEEDVDHREDGLVIIRNSVLIPISTLHDGQHVVFQLKRNLHSTVSDIKVSHVKQHNA